MEVEERKRAAEVAAHFKRCKSSCAPSSPPSGIRASNTTLPCIWSIVTSSPPLRPSCTTGTHLLPLRPQRLRVAAQQRLRRDHDKLVPRANDRAQRQPQERQAVRLGRRPRGRGRDRAVRRANDRAPLQKKELQRVSESDRDHHRRHGSD